MVRLIEKNVADDDEFRYWLKQQQQKIEIGFNLLTI